MNINDKINQLKRIFDKHNIRRTNYENQFFLDLIKSIEVETKDGESKIGEREKQREINIIDIKSEKMELMVNIEGICNNLKGQTRFNKYSFGLDIRRVPLTVFLAETKLLVRNREFNKSDIIIFYDDSKLRTGNRGFSITRDEIVTNVSGLFRVFRFQEMDHEPEFIIGHKKDAFRIHINGLSFDIKVKKNVTYTSVVFDVLRLLYKYAGIIKEENKKHRKSRVK